MSKTIQELRDAAAYLSKLAQLEMEIYDLADRVEALETPGHPPPPFDQVDPTHTPLQLATSIDNLCDRIEALENPANPRVARERDEWQHLLDTIGGDCRKHGWTDIDALIAWQMGRAAMLQARLHQARFHHDVEDRS